MNLSGGSAHELSVTDRIRNDFFLPIPHTDAMVV